jgi:signal transduction histidine kinase
MELELAPIDLNALVSAEVDAARGQAPVRQFALDLEPTLPRVTVDAARLAQAVAGLLAGAAKHTPEGGTVTVRTTSSGQAARLSITDESAGGSVESRPGVGTARRIAELHGGKAWVESMPGKGSTCHLNLPVGGPGGQVPASST